MHSMPHLCPNNCEVFSHNCWGLMHTNFDKHLKHGTTMHTKQINQHSDQWQQWQCSRGLWQLAPASFLWANVSQKFLLWEPEWASMKQREPQGAGVCQNEPDCAQKRTAKCFWARVSQVEPGLDSLKTVGCKFTVKDKNIVHTLLTVVVVMLKRWFYYFFLDKQYYSYQQHRLSILQQRVNNIDSTTKLRQSNVQY